MFKKLFSPSFIIFSSLMTRIFFALQPEFGDDSMRLYEQALRLYEHHQVSPVGAAVVYSGTALPGSLTQLLLGIPLFFSHGSLSGPAYWIAGLNFLSSLLTYQFYKKLFPKVNPNLLAAFIFFAPWSLIFTGVWNPSFLPLLGILFLIAIQNLIQSQKLFLSSALIGFCIMACLQLHLSFVLLILILMTSVISGVFKKFSRDQRKTILSGGALGALATSLSLIPYFLWISSNESQSTKGSDFLVKNVVFSFSKALDYPSYFLRFLSFPTFEISRFITRGTGLEGFQLYMQKHFYLSILLLGLEIISCFIIGFSLLFFISPKAKQLLKQLAAKKSLRDSSDEDKIFFLHWAIPLLSGLLFLFSIKNSSAHTYWVLMPMSFYPLVYLWDRLPQKKGESLMTALVMILSLCSLKIYLSSDPLTAEKVQEQLKNRIVTQQAS